MADTDMPTSNTPKREGAPQSPARHPIRQPPRTVAMIVLVILIAAGVAWYRYQPGLAAQAEAGTAFGARTACSCRQIGGRDLSDCRKDFEPGMDLVMLSEDADERSVTARVPLLASSTATWREGYGCVLDPYEG
ncbi:hypothetical protein [uncultured Croceicoccus sp.]|uniref:hypothetical protein n=1 Tax=uncultured Croceicoccus sp. TaxID=1295329 RepID=UPI00260678DE|nr:hypothetical protein [uncultured Croceicoccus sp.]